MWTFNLLLDLSYKLVFEKSMLYTKVCLSGFCAFVILIIRPLGEVFDQDNGCQHGLSSGLRPIGGRIDSGQQF